MNETILITESEVQPKASLERLLHQLGYRVEAARNSGDVLNCLANSKPGVGAVLLDLVLDNANGIDTLCEIRRFRKDLPVIVVSDVSSTSNVVDAMRRGATDFLTWTVMHRTSVFQTQTRSCCRVERRLASALYYQ